MSTVAYVTHGRKYHTDANCPLLNGGELLHDFEGDSDYGGGFTAGTYRRSETAAYAAACGKLPCLHCVPAEHRAFPPLYGQTFGHQPYTYDGVHICARCYIQHRSYREAIAWPCTSAVVLGLVERGAA